SLPKLPPEFFRADIANNQRADGRHLRLLRARGERPRRRGGYERDERAAFHCAAPPGVSDQKGSTARYGRRNCCAAGFQPAYDRLGSWLRENVLAGADTSEHQLTNSGTGKLAMF